MTTFLEFYTALLKFVNHKLFTDLGFKVPIDGLNEDGGLDVLAVKEM
jgi:Pescadillo N-terminus